MSKKKNPPKIEVITKVSTGAKIAIVLTSAAAIGCAAGLTYKCLEPTSKPEPKEETCTLTYNYCDEKPTTYKETYKVGEAPGKAPTWVPTYENHTFDGWFNAEDGDTPFDFTATLTKEGATAYAHWIEEPAEHTIGTSTLSHGGITFNVTSAVAGTTIVGTVAPDPNYHCTAVTSTDVTFIYVPGDTTFAFTMPDKNVTIDATFEAVPVGTHVVSFNSLGGSFVPGIAVEDGGTILEADKPTPTKDDEPKRFDGWFTDNGVWEDEFKFGEAGVGTPVIADIILYAKWSETPVIKYTLTADPNIEGEDPYVVGAFGPTETPTKPDDPTIPEGRSFIGWCTGKGDSGLFDFTKPLTGNTTVYAHYGATLDVKYVNTFPQDSAVNSDLDVYNWGERIELPNNQTANDVLFDMSVHGINCILNWNDEKWDLDSFNYNYNVSFEFTPAGGGETTVIPRENTNVSYDSWLTPNPGQSLSMSLNVFGQAVLKDGGTVTISVHPTNFTDIEFYANPSYIGLEYNGKTYSSYDKFSVENMNASTDTDTTMVLTGVALEDPNPTNLEMTINGETIYSQANWVTLTPSDANTNITIHLNTIKETEGKIYQIIIRAHP